MHNYAQLLRNRGGFLPAINKRDFRREDSMKNKRRFPRLDESWQLTYRVLEKEQFAKESSHQYALNISGGGICFMATETLERGTLVALDIESDNFPAPILALAKVIWCKSTRQAYEVGAEFWWIGWQNNDAQQAMADYIMSVTK